MTLTAISLIILLGIGFVLIETFLIPGVTVAGIAGIVLIAGGLILGYKIHGAPESNYLLIGTIISLIIVFTIVFRSKTWERYSLKDSITGHSPSIEADTVKVGDEGITISRLTPFGKVMVNNEIYEAKSVDGFVDPQTEVIVSKVNSTNIVIKPKNKI
jgi:membrane-bound ClpP family serine protease